MRTEKEEQRDRARHKERKERDRKREKGWLIDKLKVEREVGKARCKKR